jgi:iron-sulfur cluster assembly accessory protein
VTQQAWELAFGAVQWTSTGKSNRHGGVGSLREVPQRHPLKRGRTQMSVQDTSTVDSAAGTTGVVLSEPAAGKVKALLDQEGRDDLRLRIAVQPGGCSGLRYQLFFDERFLDGDQTYEFGGVEVIVDRMSGPYLGGATIDFVDTIEKQGFTIDNPNAGSSCACGDSFS